LVPGAQAVSCSAGGAHADGAVGSVDGTRPVDPLGGGDHGQRRCPPKGPAQRVSGLVQWLAECFSDSACLCFKLP